MCPACAAEYADPADRRFHAQPNACPACGPRVWLQDRSGKTLKPADLGAADAIAAASRMLAQGRIVAIKGIGGFHLACDLRPTRRRWRELRRRKRRYPKAFALMAADLAMVRRYARVAADEATCCRPGGAHRGPADAAGRRPGAAVAPGQNTLGFMLPYSPAAPCCCCGVGTGPMVLTSGNRSDEPQCTDNQEAGDAPGGTRRLPSCCTIGRSSIGSTTRWCGSWMRAAATVAPSPRICPGARSRCRTGLRTPRRSWPWAAELKNTICLLKDGQAILSQHLGDLEEATTARDYERNIGLYRDLYRHSPSLLAVDCHPGYRSTQMGRAWAARDDLALVEVQHHHAHIAAALADNGWPLDGGPVLGLALDGLGFGADGTVWGGELLLADYRGFRRLGWLRPVALPGGVKAMVEPWRNTYAQLAAGLGWSAVQARWPGWGWSATWPPSPSGCWTP